MRCSFGASATLGLLLSFASFLAATDSDSLPDLRIQPLGDSITQGSGSSHGNGYRGYLQARLLLSSNITVDMIGSLRSGRMIDNDHEGHSGKCLAEIAEYWKLSIASRPNLILLHAGTNNMDLEVDLDRSPDLIASIIDDIHEEVPDATILVAPVIFANERRMNQNSAAFNKDLHEIIVERQRDDRHVLEVPINITRAELADKKHPNDQGYLKMAAAWYLAIHEANDRGWLEEPEQVDPTRPENAPGLGSPEDRIANEVDEVDEVDEGDGSSASKLLVPLVIRRFADVLLTGDLVRSLFMWR